MTFEMDGTPVRRGRCRRHAVCVRARREVAYRSNTTAWPCCGARYFMSGARSVRAAWNWPRIDRIVREHIVVAGDGGARLDLRRQPRRLVVRQVLEPTVDAGDHQGGLVLGRRGQQLALGGVAGHVDPRAAAEFEQVSHVVEIGIVGGQGEGARTAGPGTPVRGRARSGTMRPFSTPFRRGRPRRSDADPRKGIVSLLRRRAMVSGSVWSWWLCVQAITSTSISSGGISTGTCRCMSMPGGSERAAQLNR